MCWPPCWPRRSTESFDWQHLFACFETSWFSVYVCVLVCMCAVFKQCLSCQERLPGGFSNENQFFLILLASPKHICSKPPDILNIMHMFKELQLQHNQPPVYSCFTASKFFLRQRTNAFPCSNIESKAQVCPCTKRIVKPLLCLR